MLTRLGKFARRLRRRYSRSHLLSRWLGYSVDKESNEPGLVILQIDGLSRQQFEAALAKRRLPFLRKLIHRGYFSRLSFYSGLPSTTPAVQGEVMYGVKAAVPAFQFLHRKSGQVFRMFEHEAAKTIVDEYFHDAEPLLKEGASYSNLYSGGAEEARFCAETTDFPNDLKKLNPLHVLLIFFLYFFTLLRILWLAGVELVVGFGDMLRGLTTRPDWKNEIKFVPSRILVSIVLREWVRIVVKLSITQGKPVIYANFLGYDEQAHRRGPSAKFAHWGLKGIDKVIEDIFRTARRADSRDYELIVFSDHGQEEAQIYEFEFGETIQEAVKNSLQEGPLGERIVQRIDWSKQSMHLDQRMRRMMRRRGRTDAPKITADELANNVIVTALGPLGHIYFPIPVSDTIKADCATHLVERENVPLVMYRKEDGRILARNARGLWTLPEDIPEVCGAHHNFARELEEDIVRLCEHPDAGDLLISGSDPDKQTITFVQEHGAHAGMGVQETRGFALIPRRVPLEERSASNGESYIRGIDLYHGAMRFLGRAEAKSLSKGTKNSERAGAKRAVRPAGETSPAETIALRVMTYNTHHCVGLDGKCRPQRIGDVIGDLDPDVVALQEMDVNRHRSGKLDQSLDLADRLGMFYQFFPVWSGADEQYGLAILSKFPLKVVRQDVLTEACHRTKSEARGAVWVTIELENHGPVHLLNTHLGLRAEERLRQVEEILSERWLADLHTRGPVIVAGDFNAGPASQVMKKMLEHYRCVQHLANNHKPRRTFPSMLPVRRLDYILVSRHFEVEGVSVPRNHFTAVASDHLPVCADLVLKVPSHIPEHSGQGINKSQQQAEPVNAGGSP